MGVAICDYFSTFQITESKENEKICYSGPECPHLKEIKDIIKLNIIRS
jgi:hypothetical protein